MQSEPLTLTMTMNKAKGWGCMDSEISNQLDNENLLLCPCTMTMHKACMQKDGQSKDTCMQGVGPDSEVPSI